MKIIGVMYRDVTAGKKNAGVRTGTYRLNTTWVRRFFYNIICTRRYAGFTGPI